MTFTDENLAHIVDSDAMKYKQIMKQNRIGMAISDVSKIYRDSIRKFLFSVFLLNIINTNVSVYFHKTFAYVVPFY